MFLEEARQESAIQLGACYCTAAAMCRELSAAVQPRFPEPGACGAGEGVDLLFKVLVIGSCLILLPQ
ncbi:hypothetical protein Holit_00675 [Hollandina sp. SP2]